MTKKKNIRRRGKLSLSRYFQRLKENDFVAVTRESSVKHSFPKRLLGRTGIVKERRGRSYIVEIKDQNKEKKFLISPIHLKKIEYTQKK